MAYIRTKELPPVIRRVLEEVGYHKADIELEIVEQVRPFYPVGKGQRAFIAPINLLTGQFEVQLGSWGGANMFVTPEPPDDHHAPPIPLPPNAAVILGAEGHRARIYVSPVTAAPLLPEAPALTMEDLVALYCHRHYRSGEPKRGCLLGYAVQPETIAKLVALGLLKSDVRGHTQLTTAGKNALSAEGRGTLWHPPREALRVDDPYYRYS